MKRKKALYTNIATTLDCVGLTQSSVIRISYCNVGLKYFYHMLKCLLLSLVFAYIYISQGSVEMHSRCGGIYNSHITAYCLQSVPVKKC